MEFKKEEEKVLLPYVFHPDEMVALCARNGLEAWATGEVLPRLKKLLSSERDTKKRERLFFLMQEIARRNKLPRESVATLLNPQPSTA